MISAINKVQSPKGEITLVTLTNASGASVTLSSLGAGIVSIKVPDRNGKLDEVALSYADVTDYFYDGPCAGKIPGRFANRIALGSFELDGKRYQLAKNCGEHALHGGPDGFQNRIWEAEVSADGVVTFSRMSPDGEEGYPGNVQVKAVYTWNDDNELKLRLLAETDSKTIINLTNHVYFNLSGQNAGSVLDHKLWMASSRYLPTTDTQIPTGEMEDVKNTPMDFTTEKKIGADIKADFQALIYGKGYDHCWVIDNWSKGKLQTVARLSDDKSGRMVEVATTQPGMQVYTGNWLDGSPVNKEGRSYNDYDAVAIECQGLPDSPNHPNFPSTELVPGEKYDETIIFKFKTI